MANTSENRFSEKIKELQGKLLTRALDQANREGGSDKLLNLVLRNLSNRVNSIRLGSQQSFDVGKLMAYPKAHDDVGISMSKVLHMNERFRSVMSAPAHIPVRANALPGQNASYYAQMERFHRVMNGDFRQSLVIGDDEQYAFGAPTGVGEDFSYLRDIENQQTERRDYRNHARANAYSAIRDYELEGEDAVAQNRARVRAQRQEQREERRMRESRRSIAVRSKQIESYRKFPWVKSLVDAGMIQKRELPKITKTLGKISKVPIVGQIIKNPVAFGATAIAALLHSFGTKQNSANYETSLWENAELYFGKPSQKFTDAAESAMITDPKAVAALWGKFASKGYNPEVALRAVGNYTKGQPTIVKDLIAKQFGGLSPDEVIAAEFFVNSIEESESRKQAKKLKQLEIEEKRGFRSGASFSERTRSTLLWLPFMKDIESRDSSLLEVLSGASLYSSRSKLFTDPLKKKPLFDLFGNWDKQQKDAEKAAESARDYDSGKIGNKQSSNAPANVSKSVAFNIGTLQVDAENTEGLMRSLMKEGSVRDHIGVIDTMDMRIRC